MSAGDFDGLAMLDLFRMEAESQIEAMVAGLLALERDPTAAKQLEACMRAAHSLKGAARIVGLDVGVRLTHAMEDCFVAAQQGHVRLCGPHLEVLLSATDLLTAISSTADQDLDRWADDATSGVGACLAALATLLATPGEATGMATAPPTPAPRPATPDPSDGSDRVLRVSAENLNRLLGLAAESLVESRWVKPFATSLLRLKRLQRDSCVAIERLRDALPAGLDPRAVAALGDALRTANECQQLLAQRLGELETFDGRALNLASRLYDEALACRMRPFADGVHALPRLVRDVAQTLGKRVRLDVIGEATQIDRDVLTLLDAPLGHLLRNAVDHGVESPEQRLAAGKAEEGCIRLEARHSAGALQVIISDDGRGIDVERVRRAVVERRLLDADAAGQLSEGELLEFLFLPGFSMKGTVTDISGRGVGLDVVQDMVKQVRGAVRVSSELGVGTRFLIQLPATLSVVRTLLVDVDGEPYAIPLAQIQSTVRVKKDRLSFSEGRQHFDLHGRRIGLVTAHQVLGTNAARTVDELSVVVLGDHKRTYGVVVDRFLGERELVVQPLDPQLGKIKDIAAGSLMDDGAPVLIVDVDDLLRSLERLAAEGRLTNLAARAAVPDVAKRKRVLVVDDSLTVRELERKLLAGRGYDVEIAIDGVDGWNAARMGDFDLVVTDIDMPRMDGIELTKRITSDTRLRSRPVIVVSYKDRDEDRRRGLEAGAAYYLTKGSFQDETLVQAVADLIGEAA